MFNVINLITKTEEDSTLNNLRLNIVSNVIIGLLLVQIYENRDITLLIQPEQNLECLSLSLKPI